jgi:hypothetical protein
MIALRPRSSHAASSYADADADADGRGVALGGGTLAPPLDDHRMQGATS